MKVRIGLMTLIVAALSFSAGTILASSEKTWANPDAGRSADEVHDAQQAASNAFWARYPKWVQDQNDGQLDVRGLARYPMLASPGDPAPTLTEATTRAEQIVLGHVDGLTFRPGADTVVNVKVTRTLQGPAVDGIEVIFPGGIQPYPDWDSPSLGVLESAPLPNPGDEVLLFLGRAATNESAFVPQSWTGVYGVNGEALDALEGNPFAYEIERLGLPGLVALLGE